MRLVGSLDQSPVLVGASLGRIAALVAAAEHPGTARGLVLVDVVVELERHGVARILEFLAAHRDGFATLEEVADAIAAYNPVRRRPRNLDGLRKNVRQHADGRWIGIGTRRSSRSATNRSDRSIPRASAVPRRACGSRLCWSGAHNRTSSATSAWRTC